MSDKRNIVYWLYFIPIIAVVFFISSNSFKKQDLTLPDEVAQDLIHYYLSQPTNKILETKDKHIINNETAEWYYTAGCLNMAMLAWYDYTNDDKALHFVNQNYQFFLTKKTYSSTLFKGEELDRSSYYNENYSPFWQYFKLSELDHCGAMGAPLCNLYLLNHEEAYLPIIERLEDFIINKQTRLSSGVFARNFPWDKTVWIDDSFMSIPFLINLARIKSSMQYWDEACHQILGFHNLLFDSESYVYSHGFIEKQNQRSVAFWGRANGWMAMSYMLVLKHLPDNHPKRNQIEANFKAFMTGLVNHQSKMGMWHQLLDKPDSYLESSCTAMFIAAMATGVNENILNRELFEPSIHKAWIGISSKIIKGQGLKDICVGTDIKNELSPYYNRPKSQNDLHGNAALIMACIEMSKIMKSKI